MDNADGPTQRSSDAASEGDRGPTDDQVAAQGSPQITNAITSQAVLNAISQMDTKLAFDMMLLSEQMNTLDSENKCLKEENLFLKEKLAKQTQEQNEMYHYFNGKLDQHVALIASLEKEAALAKQEHEQMVHDREVHMENAQSQLQAELTRANEEIEALRLELRQLHVFSQQKLQIETQMDELEATLASRTKQFEDEKLELERKSIFEKDRVKKEMLLHMKEMKEELLHRTDNQLNTTTKRTMMENDHFMEELSFQNKETEKLLTRYHQLEDEVKGLRVKTKMLEDNEAVMAKKNYYYQKILQKLQKKEEKFTLDTLIKDEDALLLQQAVEIEDAEKKKSNSDEIKSSKARIDEVETVLKNANDWIHVFQQEKQYIVAQQDEIIQFLCRAIHDAAVEMGRSGGGGGGQQQPGSSKIGGTSDQQIAKLAKETTKMDDFIALVPPLVVLDELSPEENRFVMLFLLEKMKIYQQRISLLFQNNRQVSPFGAPGGKHQDLISKQLGVELPPIGNLSSQIQPGVVMGNGGGNSNPMSPLKQKRRMFAHVTSSVAAAIEGGEAAATNQCNADSPLQSRKPGIPTATAAASHHSLPSNSLLAMAMNQFNFLSTAPASTGKSPIKSQSQYQSSPNTKNSNGQARAVPSGSPVKHGGVRKVQPPANASVFAKKAHGGRAGSGSGALTASADSILDPTGLLQSQSMLTAWSNSSIPTLADVEAAILE